MAAKICSIVLIFALFSSSVVPLETSVTLSTSALIVGLFLRSIL